MDLKALLQSALDESGRDLNVSLDYVVSYALVRMAHLAAHADSPDFQAMVIIERNNVAIEAGLQAADAADNIDSHIIGIIQGALAIGAAAI